MKSITYLVAFFATTIVAASLPGESGYYLRRADEMAEGNNPIADLSVTDERFGDEVFVGTAKSIYEQMKERKPELFVNETDVSETEPSLEKRQGTFNCNWYSNINDAVGQWWWCHEGTAYLRKLGTAWCYVDAPAPACARVSCSNSCGMFLCNKQPRRVEVHCKDIATDIAAIANQCGSSNIGYAGGARDFASHFIGLRGQRC
ncbi:hypothetical protein DE146DRAFT_772525 [Phaeosphaeria sp. MPI-PUGE-AT-0046c]|nr:hypothetical protein DE146DRAFT_772525 [Phaeosphaeria sp. MPI-PUGE-AT-0046c]